MDIQDIKFRPITIGDKSTIERYTGRWGLESSGYNFTTMLIWGRDSRICMAEKEDMLFLRSCCTRAQVLYPPLCLREAAYPRALAMAVAQFRADGGAQPLFKGVTEELAPLFLAEGYSLSEDRANFDYVYAAQDLITLAGKKFHAKRNHINQFLAVNDFEYISVTADMRAECMAVYDNWQAAKGEDDPLDERQAIEMIFANMEALGVVGGGIRVNGALAAFSLGERMNADMAIIHIEKADDMPGLFALINREFVAHAFADVRYINREEDMGLDGLRRAKLSYNPVRMLPKYDAIPPERP